jgi:hypothetical protein
MQIKSMWFVLSLVAAYGGGLGTGIVLVHKPITEKSAQGYERAGQKMSKSLEKFFQYQ